MEISSFAVSSCKEGNISKSVIFIDEDKLLVDFINGDWDNNSFLI